MNAEQIVAELVSQYPDKNILQLPPENPSEIICEIDPTSEHPNKSVAIAVVDSSYPHVHHKSIETYEVLRGELSLFIDGKNHPMKSGESYVIQPGVVHWAKANAAWVRVSSVPGWATGDHILIHDAEK